MREGNISHVVTTIVGVVVTVVCSAAVNIKNNK